VVHRGGDFPLSMLFAASIRGLPIGSFSLFATPSALCPKSPKQRLLPGISSDYRRCPGKALQSQPLDYTFRVSISTTTPSSMYFARQVGISSNPRTKAQLLDIIAAPSAASSVRPASRQIYWTVAPSCCNQLPSRVDMTAFLHGA